MLHKLFSIVITTLLACNSVQAVEINKGASYFTRVNIWYENPDNIPSTNYHRGDMIPVNSKIILRRLAKNVIAFEDQDGQVFTIIHNSGYVRKSIRELFDHLFSAKDVMLENETYAKFTPLEKENIMQGTVTEGMSKEAVVMAYGYPPTHKTPSLNRPVWRYWDARASQLLVYFKGGKVSRVEEYSPGQFLFR